MQWQKHLKNSHNNEPNFCCLTCYYAYLTKDLLNGRDVAILKNDLTIFLSKSESFNSCREAKTVISKMKCLHDALNIYLQKYNE